MVTRFPDARVIQHAPAASYAEFLMIPYLREEASTPLVARASHPSQQHGHAHILHRMPLRSGIADTDVTTQRKMTALYAAMTPAEKLRRVRELTVAANLFALAGLRTRHPGDTVEQLSVRLARIRLGDDVVDAVYGATARQRDS